MTTTSAPRIAVDAAFAPYPLLRQRNISFPAKTKGSTSNGVEFPTNGLSVEFARLSQMIYKLDFVSNWIESAPWRHSNLTSSNALCQCSSSQIYSFEQQNTAISPADYNSDGTSKLTPHFAHQNKYGTQVAIVTSDKYKYIAVVFRGTQSREDWIIDFQTLLTSYGPRGFGKQKNYKWDTPWNVLVHHGFNKAFFGQQLDVLLCNAVQQVREAYPNYGLVVCGHSLGGSLAILAGTYFANQMPDIPIKVYAYAGARVGNSGFRDWVYKHIPSLTIWRYVFDDDIVPRIAPSFMGYVDVGNLIRLVTNDLPKIYYHQWGDRKLGYAGVPLAQWYGK